MLLCTLEFVLVVLRQAGVGLVLAVVGVLASAVWWRKEGRKLRSRALPGLPLLPQLFGAKPAGGPSKKWKQKPPSAMAGAAAARRARAVPPQSPKSPKVPWQSSSLGNPKVFGDTAFWASKPPNRLCAFLV
jgi:hypothetical protein